MRRLLFSLIVALVAIACVVPANARAATRSWDRRLLPIARDVERLRGLKFEHPVPVDFLSDAEFTQRIAAQASNLSDADTRELRRTEAQLRAVGLLASNVDLRAAQTSLVQSGALAFYSPKTKRVTVRGTELTPAVRVTLAHELTHALQDQHFGLTKLERIAASRHASAALTALVEGDAVRIQQLYARELSTADEAEYERTTSATSSSVLDQVRASGVPDSLVAFLQSPYLLGPPMLQLLQSARGDHAVDALFRSPPRTDSAYVTPTTLVDSVAATKVEPPALQPGETADGKADVFGAFALDLVLATRLDPVAALDVADGWAGDAMITFRHNDVTCVRASFAGRNQAALTAIADALRDWVAGAPPSTAESNVDGSLATLTTCEPPPGTPTGDNRSFTALTLVTVRNMLLATLARQGLRLAAATCAANGVVADPSFRPVLDAAAAEPNATPSADILQPLQQRVLAIAARCAAVK